MILQAKARPVRIRIKSGGEEHSSFESLKRHFCVKDLLPSAKDGRLSRWLRQQEKDMEAERIEALQESLSSISDKDAIPEQNYIQFVLAFFNFDGNISSRQELFDQWSISGFSDCLEYQLLNDEIQQALAERKKKEKINAMKMSYKEAILGYNNTRDLCTKDEWIRIFELFKVPQSENADYNWLLFQLSEDKTYLSKAAKLGHCEANKITKKTYRFDESIREGIFKTMLADFPETLNNIASRTSAKKKIYDLGNNYCLSWHEGALRDDLLRIIEAFESNISCKGFVDTLSNVKLLKDESVFLKGLFWDGDNLKPYAMDTYRTSKHVLSEFFLMLSVGTCSSGKIIATDSLGTIETMLINVDTLKGIKSKINNEISQIVRFLLVHIFDEITYTYEKL